MKSNIYRIIGLLIFAYIIYIIELDKMWAAFLKVKLFWFILALSLNIPQLYLKSFRWLRLLDSQGHTLKHTEAFLFYSSSVYYGIITPGRLGDFSKVIYLKQYKGMNVSTGFSSVFIDRMCDLYLLSLLGLLGLLHLNPWPGSEMMGGVGIIFMAVITIIIFFPSKLRSMCVFFYEKIVLQKLPEQVRGEIDGFTAGINDLCSGMHLALILTCLCYLLFFLQCYIILYSLSIPVTYIEIVYIMALTNLVTFIPISTSGIGTREASLIYLLSPMGISTEMILAYSVCVFIVFFGGGGVIGFITSFAKPLTFKQGHHNSL